MFTVTDTETPTLTHTPVLAQEVIDALQPAPGKE